MKKLIYKALRNEIGKDGQNRRHGPRISVWGKRVGVNITLPSEIAKKAKAMANAKRLSLSKMIEKMLLNEDKVFQEALMAIVERGKLKRSSVDPDKILESFLDSGRPLREAHKLPQTTETEAHIHIPVSTQEPERE